MAFDGQLFGCSMGRGGVVLARAKLEGDGCTPLGEWPLRCAILRPDRGYSPPGALPWRWMRRDDGWCDDPRDPDYNRPVRLPFRSSAEQMWRDDGLYDAVLVLGHNDRPAVPLLGSAIFMHLREGATTEGCVAIDADAMMRLLAVATPEMVEIR